MVRNFIRCSFRENLGGNLYTYHIDGPAPDKGARMKVPAPGVDRIADGFKKVWMVDVVKDPGIATKVAEVYPPTAEEIAAKRKASGAADFDD